MPVVPPTLRSWGIVPWFITSSSSFWPGWTSIEAGSTLNSVSLTSTVLVSVELAVFVPSPFE